MAKEEPTHPAQGALLSSPASSWSFASPTHHKNRFKEEKTRADRLHTMQIGAHWPLEALSAGES